MISLQFQVLKLEFVIFCFSVQIVRAYSWFIEQTAFLDSFSNMESTVVLILFTNILIIFFLGFLNS